MNANLHAGPVQTSCVRLRVFLVVRARAHHQPAGCLPTEADGIAPRPMVERHQHRESALRKLIGDAPAVDGAAHDGVDAELVGECERTNNRVVGPCREDDLLFVVRRGTESGQAFVEPWALERVGSLRVALPRDSVPSGVRKTLSDGGENAHERTRVVVSLSRERLIADVLCPRLCEHEIRIVKAAIRERDHGTLATKDAVRWRDRGNGHAHATVGVQAVVVGSIESGRAHVRLQTRRRLSALAPFSGLERGFFFRFRHAERGVCVDKTRVERPSTGIDYDRVRGRVDVCTDSGDASVAHDESAGGDDGTAHGHDTRVLERVGGWRRRRGDERGRESQRCQQHAESFRQGNLLEKASERTISGWQS